VGWAFGGSGPFGGSRSFDSSRPLGSRGPFGGSRLFGGHLSGEYLPPPFRRASWRDLSNLCRGLTDVGLSAAGVVGRLLSSTARETRLRTAARFWAAALRAAS
jgi:hypothetical protein